ncbi:MAG: hypothetical protein AAGF04_03140 [Chlamydiota bacterium]
MSFPLQSFSSNPYLTILLPARIQASHRNQQIDQAMQALVGVAQFALCLSLTSSLVCSISLFAAHSLWRMVEQEDQSHLAYLSTAETVLRIFYESFPKNDYDFTTVFRSAYLGQFSGASSTYFHQMCKFYIQYNPFKPEADCLYSSEELLYSSTKSYVDMRCGDQAKEKTKTALIKKIEEGINNDLRKECKRVATIRNEYKESPGITNPEKQQLHEDNDFTEKERATFLLKCVQHLHDKDKLMLHFFSKENSNNTEKNRKSLREATQKIDALEKPFSKRLYLFCGGVTTHLAIERVFHLILGCTLSPALSGLLRIAIAFSYYIFCTPNSEMASKDVRNKHALYIQSMSYTARTIRGPDFTKLGDVNCLIMEKLYSACKSIFKALEKREPALVQQALKELRETLENYLSPSEISSEQISPWATRNPTTIADDMKEKRREE